MKKINNIALSTLTHYSVFTHTVHNLSNFVLFLFIHCLSFHKLAEKKNSQKTPEDMLNHSMPCTCNCS